MKMKVKIKKIKFQKGFSIMEVTLSAFILIVGLVATVNLMASSISHSADSRNQIIAAQLAQEGIELINNIRDNNWASGKNTFDSPFPSGNCTINYNYNYGTGFGIICLAPSYKLYYKNNFYIHNSSGTPTKFKRKIIIANDNDPIDTDNKRITSMVNWSNNSFPAISSCSTANKCTYSEMVLSSTNYH